MKHVFLSLFFVGAMTVMAVAQGMPHQAQVDIPIPDSPPGNQVVYVSENGTLYHLRSCCIFKKGYVEIGDSSVVQPPDNQDAAAPGHGQAPMRMPPEMVPSPQRYSISLKEAKLQGYKPCKTCQAPK